MASHTPNSRSYSISTAKPVTIATLAERALENIWDERKELKHFLRIAERSRKQGKEFVTQGDLESAFVSFARAATLVLEKLPTHRDYKKLLNESQRQNLMLVCDLFIFSFQTLELENRNNPAVVSMSLHSACATCMLTCSGRTVKIS
jgi:hypothetical protein